MALYFWEEQRKNILDCAPRPVQPSRRSLQGQNKLQCLCHGTSWSDRTTQVLSTMRKSTKPCTIYAPADIEKTLKKQVCSCENKGQQDLNLPKEEIENSIWEIHTYFNNLFNSKNASELATLRDFLSKVLDECRVYNDISRFVFLQRLRSFLDLELLDIEAFVEQLIVEQTQHELTTVCDTKSACDSVLELYEPSVMDWLEQSVMSEM